MTIFVAGSDTCYDIASFLAASDTCYDIASFVEGGINELPCQVS